MTLYAEGQSLEALQEQEGVERRDRCALVAKKSRSDLNDVSQITDCLCEYDTVIRRVRLGKSRELVVLSPVELTG